MSSIKIVFSTFVKTFIYIFAFYFCFNIMAFAISYFRVVGASYSLQQVVMDNNYLTTQDFDTFNRYLSKLDTAYLTDLHVVINTDPEGVATGRDTFVNDREQYGNMVEVGIASKFTFVFPLMRNEMTTDNKGVDGLDKTRNAQWLSGEEMENKRNAKRIGVNLDVINPVVGLQYYSDLR